MARSGKVHNHAEWFGTCRAKVGWGMGKGPATKLDENAAIHRCFVEFEPIFAVALFVVKLISLVLACTRFKN
jgi:hypothetical protein